MINTFITSFKIKNTYMANTIIYWIIRLPLIGKYLPESLYKSNAIKTIANVISGLIELGGVFAGKFIYLFFLFSVSSIIPENSRVMLPQLYIILAVVGSIMNSQLFNPTKDKFYAILLLKMDAKEYALSNYVYFLGKMLIGFVPAVLVIALMLGTGWYYALLLPIFTVCVKVITNCVMLIISKKTGKAVNENTLTPVRWIIVIALTALAIGLDLAGLAMSETAILILICMAVVLFIPSAMYVWRFDDYSRIYKRLFQNSAVMFNRKKYVADAGRAASLKAIEKTGSDTSTKTGYGYFNELFNKRHRKLLTRSAKNTALVLLAILSAAVCWMIFAPEFRGPVNKAVLNTLPYFVFIMYAINRGQVITRTMFTNCDEAMLSYSFYRQPWAILALFTQRLKTLVVINLLPASVVALGLPLILYISGGTDNPINYVIQFISIVAVSVFYSVHHLVMYYLLQPYSKDVEIKNPVYNTVSGITYGLSFICIYIKIPTVVFGSFLIVFAVLYVAVSLILAYRLAPKTFKLR